MLIRKRRIFFLLKKKLKILTMRVMKKSFLSLLVLNLLSALHGQDQGACNPVMPWTNYTYFYFNDKRHDAPTPAPVMTAHGQNVRFGVDYAPSPCWTWRVWGSYETTKGKSPPSGATEDNRNLQAQARSEGWGGGLEAGYHIARAKCYDWLTYLDLAYVNLLQGMSVVDRNRISHDLNNHNSGYRAEILYGMRYSRLFNSMIFSADLFYLFVHNHSILSLDVLALEFFGGYTNSGRVNAVGTLFFRPVWVVQPFVTVGVGEEVHRRQLPGHIPLPGRFEWRAGAGATGQYSVFVFTTAYNYLRRHGPQTHTFSLVVRYLF